MFDGHVMYKICDNWIFNLTEFIGYKIKTKQNGQVESYTKAYKLNKEETNEYYYYDKYISVPVGVLRKSMDIVENYNKEALLNEGF